VGAAVAVLDRVGEAGDELGVAVVPLHRDVDRALRGFAVAAASDGATERNDVGHRGLVGVEIGDVGRDPALELEQLLAIGALVFDLDLEPAVEIGELSQLGRQLIEAELEDVLEDLGIGVKRGLGTVALA
jgi:hypothetical protein